MIATEIPVIAPDVPGQRMLATEIAVFAPESAVHFAEALSARHEVHQPDTAATAHSAHTYFLDINLLTRRPLRNSVPWTLRNLNNEHRIYMYVTVSSALREGEPALIWNGPPLYHHVYKLKNT